MPWGPGNKTTKTWNDCCSLSQPWRFGGQCICPTNRRNTEFSNKAGLRCQRVFDKRHLVPPGHWRCRGIRRLQFIEPLQRDRDTRLHRRNQELQLICRHGPLHGRTRQNNRQHGSAAERKQEEAIRNWDHRIRRRHQRCYLQRVYDYPEIELSGPAMTRYRIEEEDETPDFVVFIEILLCIISFP